MANVDSRNSYSNQELYVTIIHTGSVDIVCYCFNTCFNTIKCDPLISKLTYISTVL